MMDYGGMGSFGWAWMALGLVFWVTVVAFIAWAVGQVGRRPTSENAEEILRRRYAGGEIDDKEFESATRTLRRG